MKIRILVAFALCAVSAALFLGSVKSAGQGAPPATPSKAQLIEDLVYGNRITTRVCSTLSAM